MALIRLRTECQDGETGAALYVHPTRRRTGIVRGYVITDPAVLAELAELNAPANEVFLEIPLDTLCNLQPEDIPEVTS
jgi:hypothetical protein